MKLTGPWIYPTRNVRGVTRWRVRWLVRPGDGTERSCSRSGFTLKGRAEAFAEILRDAVVHRNGWCLDPVGQPVRIDAPGPLVLECVRAYVVANFPAVRSTTRAKNASALQWIVALTLRSPADEELVSALESGRRSAPEAQGVDAGRDAAQYLRRVVLTGRPEPALQALPGPDQRGRLWLEQHSRPIASIDELDVARLRGRMVAGRPYRTARTYWASASAFFSWCHETERVRTHPLRGSPKIRRDRSLERCDAEAVPDPNEVDAIAGLMAARFGDAEGALVRVMAFAALRLSEGLDLRVSDFVVRDGRWWVRVSAQRPEVVRSFDWDGGADRRPTKNSRGAAPTSGALVPLPGRAQTAAATLVAAGTIRPDGRVVSGPRGGRLTPDTFRDSHWRSVVADLFPAPHRLSRVTPHVLRHAGMTYWLRSGVDHKRCQLWGRWASLMVMLDVYAGVLPSDDEAALALLDAGVYAGRGI